MSGTQRRIARSPSMPGVEKHPSQWHNTATVSVRIEEEGKTAVGQSADTDTLVASANAYLSALNKMIIKRKKTAPMEHETQKMKGI